MNITYIGIDPGATGAIAAIFPDGECNVWDYPGDEVALADILTDIRMGRDCRAVVEQQQAMPKQGVTSMFKLGLNFGAHLGALAALQIAVRTVRPAEWKKGYVPPKSDKGESLTVARRLFPTAPLTRKKDHGRAEALLLADYARKVWAA